MELGYARVSTTHQDLERQLDALGTHGIPAERIYADKKTGATLDRPGFADLLRYTRAGDTIVATNLDRLGRNLRECLNIVHDLREQDIGIKTLKDPIPIDTTDTSPMAEVAVALLALFAHMDLSLNDNPGSRATSYTVQVITKITVPCGKPAGGSHLCRPGSPSSDTGHKVAVV